MAGITKIVNGQEISGMFPIQTLDPDQYGMYRGVDVTVTVDTIIPVGERVMGGLLPEFIDNHITLNAGIYVIRLPRYSYAGTETFINFYGRDTNNQILCSCRVDLVATTSTTCSPLFFVVLERATTIKFTATTDATARSLLTDATTLGIETMSTLIIKLDQPRISSLDKGVDGTTTIIDGHGKIRAIEVAKAIGGSITENVVKFVANSTATIADIIAKINGLITTQDNIGLSLSKGGYAG